MNQPSQQRKILTGHQPVYLPWAGLFHKISLADEFVFMDDVQYLKEDWNNRNRIKGTHGEIWLTVPVVKCPTDTKLKDVAIFNNPNEKQYWGRQHWRSIEVSYSKAKFFQNYKDFFEDMYLVRRWESLSELCYYQLVHFLRFLDIQMKVHKQSEVGYEGFKSDLILNMCIKHQAAINVFGTHGKDYVNKEDFAKQGIEIYFQDYVLPVYEQRFPPFVKGLSAIDILLNYGNDSLQIILDGNITKEQLLDLL